MQPRELGNRDDANPLDGVGLDEARWLARGVAGRLDAERRMRPG